MAKKTKQSFYLESDFETWLDGQTFKDAGSRGCILSRMRCLDTFYLSSFTIKDKNNNDITFWEILDGILSNKHGVKINYLEDLMVAMQSRLKKDENIIRNNSGKAPTTVRNYLSAFSSYYGFIIEYVDSKKVSNNKKIQPDEDANIKNIQGNDIKLDGQQLIRIFASRLNTQDRCSGNKVWLPFGLIGKILREGRAKGYTKKHLSDWITSEAKKVKIHIANGSVVVKDNYTDIFTINTQTKEVYVTVSGINHRVYNPPLPGQSSKRVMSVNRISQTDIDHIVDINTILTTPGVQFNGLHTLTVWIQGVMNIHGITAFTGKDSRKNKKIVYDYIINNPSIYSITHSLINEIENDLNFITKTEKLQLTTQTWNRSAKKLAQNNGASTAQASNGVASVATSLATDTDCVME